MSEPLRREPLLDLAAQAVGTAAPAATCEAKLYISFDGTGVPVRKSELRGRRGKQADGSARTREAKLGCVFNQVGLDKEGYPQRDPNSTTYVGAIESSALFGWRMLYAEALRQGLEQAKTVVVLTDGARYNHTGGRHRPARSQSRQTPACLS